MTAPSPSVVLLGAGGHARVVRALAAVCGLPPDGVCDPALARAGVSAWEGVQVLGDDSVLDGLDPASVRLLNGIGNMPGSNVRGRVYAELTAKNFHFPALIHDAAWVAPGVAVAEAVQIMAGAVVQPGCRIGAGSILNTRAGIDHDCTIGEDVHIAPGATLCGAVQVGSGAFIGAGATVIQEVRIGARAMVAAGAVVTSDLPEGARWRGAERREA